MMKKEYITDKLSDLNDRYLVLYGRLHKNNELLPEKQIEMSVEALIRSYEREVEVLLDEACIAAAEDVFVLREKVKRLTPKGGLFGNKLGRALKKRVKAECNALIERMGAVSCPPEAPVQEQEPPELPESESDCTDVVPVVLP